MQKDRKRINKQQSINRRELAATGYVLKRLNYIRSPYIILAANSHLEVQRLIQNI